ncbi:acyltransferase family protein [Chitinophaga nivalis]|uniref:Acyltransferase n=1 Tax=Chitinophaga nivalis TaxID=2991709 RepID=A0ABT3IM37_9BACT|nr:acyltransferase [Chitinophaga nivalis]MCW3465300.1 acyltransferase [Chitinophaga nivalis]MCW3485008.1 acyltransferase [Chitinophaga nivalis]
MNQPMVKMVTRDNWMDNLRSFITLLVVAHHSSLAYTTFASFNKQAYIASTHPIVDAQRWRGMDLFEDFNDIFFMSLMFLISGIFVVRSLEQKGTAKFIRDRFFRLFIPFMVGVTLLMLLAYYPAFYLAYGVHDVKAYIIDYFTVEAWPVGPPWFIWVLFVFNLLLAVVYPLIKKGLHRCSGFLVAQGASPFRLLLGVYLFSWILYVPVVLVIDAGSWTGIGPFDFQISRVLLYAGYFLLGAVWGIPGLSQGIFATGTAFVRRWPVWLMACLAMYGCLKWSEAPLISMMARHTLTELQATLIYRSMWILSCVLSGIALLTTFKSCVNHTGKIWQSLAANAYGIYLLHYIFVVWCQFYLLEYHLPPLLKMLITTAVAILVSWWLTALLRKNKVIGRYL